ncbi:MAG: HigA family addiction module antitoxin [Algisphaera sp.]
MPKKLAPVHPGEILKVEFLDELEITPYRLAADTGMPQSRIGKIISGERGITADTALRLGHYFGMTPQFWLNLQTRHDLDVAEDKIGHVLAHMTTAKAAG